MNIIAKLQLTIIVFLFLGLNSHTLYAADYFLDVTGISLSKAVVAGDTASINCKTTNQSSLSVTIQTPGFKATGSLGTGRPARR